MDFVAAIFGALLKWLAGWWAKRQSAKSIEAANDRQAQASIDAAAIRDDSDAAEQDARAQTAVDVAAVRRAAADPDADGLQRQRDTVQQAIDRANAGDRVR